MSVFQNPNNFSPSISDRAIRNVAFALLTLVILASGWATVLHRIEPNPHPINLWVPPINGLIHLGLLLYLIRKPDRTIQVFWMVTITLFVSNTIAAWYFTLQAALSPEIALVETLPPISAFPIIGITTMFIFARPKQVMITAIVAWIIIALPILLYLILHPQELFSPRGLEMAFTLGPIMTGVAILVPFHRGVEQTVQTLRSDRDRIQRLADLDPLTQTYNRRGFENILQDVTANCSTNLGVILFDIDHFKRINDRHGHSAGDTVLSQVAHRCQTSLRKEDYITRWGGEEFLILIQGAEAQALCKIAENLRQVIANTSIPPVGTVTASFGVTQFQPTDSIESLIHRVDEAMYAAKHQGRNRVILR